MELEYTLTEEDILNFNIYHSDNSPTTKKNILIGRTIVPIILIAFIFLLGFPNDKNFFIGISIIYLPILSIWLIFYPKYIRYSIKKNVKALLAEDLNTGMIGYQKLIITETEFIQITEFSNTQRFKEFITKIEESSEYIYLYLSSITTLIIPKSVLWNNKINKENLYKLLDNKKLTKSNMP
ncbi:YcxB family protein [Leptospira sp. WS39.C2]